MNLTFFKLSPSLFYADIFQSLRNSSLGRDGGFKLKGKSTDRGMTSSPVRRRELEKDVLGGVAHITPTDCTSMFTADLFLRTSLKASHRVTCHWEDSELEHAARTPKDRSLYSSNGFTDAISVKQNTCLSYKRTPALAL